MIVLLVIITDYLDNKIYLTVKILYDTKMIVADLCFISSSAFSTCDLRPISKNGKKENGWYDESQ